MVFEVNQQNIVIMFLSQFTMLELLPYIVNIHSQTPTETELGTRTLTDCMYRLNRPMLLKIASQALSTCSRCLWELN